MIYGRAQRKAPYLGKYFRAGRPQRGLGCAGSGSCKCRTSKCSVKKGMGDIDWGSIISSGITAGSQIATSFIAPQQIASQNANLQSQIYQNALAAQQQQAALAAAGTNSLGIPSSFNIGGTMVPAWAVLGGGGIVAAIVLVKVMSSR